jgi:hypothetical protein
MQQMRAHQGEAVAGEFDAGLQLPILPLAALLQVLVETVLQMLGTRRGFNTRIGEYQQAGDVLVLVGGVTQLFVIELTQVVPHRRFHRTSKALGWDYNAKATINFHVGDIVAGIRLPQLGHDLGQSPVNTLQQLPRGEWQVAISTGCWRWGTPYQQPGQ